MTIKENFVPYEIAKLLAEQGFNDPTLGFWATHMAKSKEPFEKPQLIFCTGDYWETAENEGVNFHISAPLWQQACAFIYDKSKQMVLVHYSPAYKRDFLIYELENALKRIK